MSMFFNLRRIWQLHPPLVLAVRASREHCLQTLIAASRPSQQRLHLRSLFVEGRRYHLYATAKGFALTTDTRPLWGGQRRKRTRAAAVGIGELISLADETATLVRMHARMRLPAALAALLMPLFVSSIVVFLPWQPSVIALLVMLLLGLAALSYRFEAAYQANELFFFVQKSLADLPLVSLPELQAAAPDVLINAKEFDFWQQWEIFFDEQTQAGSPGEGPPA